MAISLTRNLKLRIPQNADDTTKYNLNKIDELASTFQVNTNGIATIRSKSDINFEPNSPDVGGSGVGGHLVFGTTDQPLSSITFNATSVSFSGGAITLLDSAAGGTKFLNLVYKSDITGSSDLSADHSLNIDVEGASRNLILGGDLGLLGGDFNINLSSLTNGQILVYDSFTQAWQNQDQAGSGSSSELAVSWLPADGATKIILHSLNSRNLAIQVLDENSKYIEVDSITCASTTQIILIANQVPTGTWVVLIKQIG